MKTLISSKKGMTKLKKMILKKMVAVGLTAVLTVGGIVGLQASASEPTITIQTHSFTRNEFIELMELVALPWMLRFNGNIYTHAEFFDAYNGLAFREMGFASYNATNGLRIMNMELREGISQPGGVTVITPPVITPVQPVATPIPMPIATVPVVPAQSVSPIVTPTPDEINRATTPEEVFRGMGQIVHGNLTLLTNNELTALAETAPSHFDTRSATTFTHQRLNESQLEAWIYEYWELGGLNAYELEIIRLINDERIKHGLAPLVISIELSMESRFRSQEMLDLQYFSHQSPIYGWGETLEMFGHKNINPRHLGASGNLGRGRGTPEIQVNSWMNSPGHRAQILGVDFISIGIGRVGGYTTARFGS